MSVSWISKQSLRYWIGIASSSDGSKLAAVVNGGYIYTSADSGANWTQRGTQEWSYTDIASSSDGSKLVATASGYIFTSADYGVNWTRSDTGNAWVSVASYGGANVIGIRNMEIYLSGNYGVNWSPSTAAGSRDWKAVATSSNGTTLAAIVNNGQIYISTNSGSSWSPRATNRAWADIASSSNGAKLVAVVNGGYIYTSTDYGSNWTQRGSSRAWTCVTSSSNGDVLLAGTSYGNLWLSTDAGINWTSINNAGTADWKALNVIPDGTKVYAVGTNTPIYIGTVTLYSAPSAPTAVSATAGYKQATVSFTAPTSTGGAAITSYTVTSSPGSITATGASSPLTVTGLTAGTSYTFTVTATNAQSLTSSASSTSAAVTPYDIPVAPATPSTVSGDMDITVSWTVPSNGGSAITGYKLRYSSNGGSSWGAATSVGNVLTYNVTGLTDNTNYQFQIAATNAAGDSVWSTATANVQTVTTPSAPQNVALTAQQAAIKVDWEAPSNNGGSAITGYTIRYRVQGTVPLTTVDNISPQNTSTTKTYTITGLTGGSLYDVYVYAFNAVDATKQGAAAYASATPYDVPGAPQAVTAAGGNGYVDISFTAAAANGSAITLYTVSTTGKPDVTGLTSPIRVPGLTNDQQYTFSIKATNAAGDGQVVTVLGVPVNPAVTTVSTSSINVSNTTQAAQVVQSAAAAPPAVVTQIALATINQVKASSSVSDILTAAKNVNASLSSTSLKQSVAKAAGQASVSTATSTASTVAAKISEYKERINAVKTATVADASLESLVQDTVKGAAKAVLNTVETSDVNIIAVIVAGNTATGSTRPSVKSATVTEVEDLKSGTSIPVSGDALVELLASLPAETKTSDLANVSSLNILIANKDAKTVNLPVRGEAWYTPMMSGVEYTMTNSMGSETAKFTFDAATNTMTKDGLAFVAGTEFTINNVTYPTYALGSLAGGGGTIQPTPIEVNLNVEISANGTLNVLGYSPTAPSNLVIATNMLPVDTLYDSISGIGLFEFWEPDNLNDIEAQLASTQTLGGVQGYKITAKKLALGLQNVLVGELDAKSAEPFNMAPKYGAAGAQNGSRVMTGFGRLALMAYAHYLMGHVQATAAITNDTDFMKGMLSLNSDTLTDYKYASIGNYDAAVAPWNTTGTPTDANLAVRLVKALLDANTSSSLVSNGAANSVANIVKQVIGQDASRATDEDNNKYSPENHGLLRFYPDDIIYISINLTTPVVNVGTGQLVSDSTLEGLYTNATGDKKYTLKITLGPMSV
jgi:hypothetical protein